MLALFANVPCIAEIQATSTRLERRLARHVVQSRHARHGQATPTRFGRRHRLLKFGTSGCSLEDEPNSSLPYIGNHGFRPDPQLCRAVIELDVMVAEDLG